MSKKKFNLCVENEEYDKKHNWFDEYEDRLSDIIINIEIIAFGDGIIDFDKCKMTTFRHTCIRYTAINPDTNEYDRYIFETGNLSGSSENVIAEPGDVYSRRKESKRKNEVKHYIHKTQLLDTGCLVKYPKSDNGLIDVSKNNITIKDAIIHALQWSNVHNRNIKLGHTQYPNNCRGFVDSSLKCLFGLNIVNWNLISGEFKC